MYGKKNLFFFVYVCFFVEVKAKSCFFFLLSVVIVIIRRRKWSDPPSLPPNPRGSKWFPSNLAETSNSTSGCGGMNCFPDGVVGGATQVDGWTIPIKKGDAVVIFHKNRDGSFDEKSSEARKG